LPKSNQAPLHDALLVFAESLLTTPSGFRPLIGTLLGYVANESSSQDHTNKINEIFSRIKNLFTIESAAEEFAATIHQQAIETYFCAARMIVTNSALAHQLKMDVCAWFNECPDFTAYVEAFYLCARNTYNSDQGDEILETAFGQLVDDIARRNNASTSIEETRTDNLYLLGLLSAHIATGLPKSSTLEVQIINQFSESFDALYHLNKAKADQLMADCHDLCHSNREVNLHFFAKYDQKRTTVQLQEEHHILVRPTASYEPEPTPCKQGYKNMLRALEVARYH